MQVMSDLIHFTLLVVVYLMPCGNVPIQLDVFCLFFTEDLILSIKM